VIDLDFIGNLTAEAGRATLEVYNASLDAEGKDDPSSVTVAGRRAYQIISEGLRSTYPDIPVLSEEGKDIPYSTRMNWPRFWLVNPIDGRDGFLKKTGEFTVDVALVEGVEPVLGAIYLPARGLLYMAAKGAGCWRMADGVKQSLKVSAPSAEKPVRVMISRSDTSTDTIVLIGFLPRCVTLSRSSALKFCAIAAGETDFYPRLDATWEWDTAAGQVIVIEAGGVMTGLKGEPFTYNKPDLLNGPFLVGPSLEWLKEIDILDCQERIANAEIEFEATSCR
jgi:3'(2'), 5'-bisphosphate nucleotidase